ncbi:MAG: 50S ribosomal protein L21 [Thermodesulfobacteriota bacterium]|nr:50S ribosomal protein L21 [Thermodesulfobacteriota bacterium]
MYAIIKTGGKQYRVQEGDTLKVEKLEGKEGSEINFDNVLMYSDGEKITLGEPDIESAIVKGHVVEQAKDKKVIVFKYKRRKGYRKTQGHRQYYTAVKIDSIQV